MGYAEMITERSHHFKDVLPLMNVATEIQMNKIHGNISCFTSKFNIVSYIAGNLYLKFTFVWSWHLLHLVDFGRNIELPEDFLCNVPFGYQ